jgi:predicted DCC family thiol-disulfide oxidoreductase YuxK
MGPPPVLVYDGDCAFCTSCVRFAERHLHPRCTTTPWQSADLRALGVTREQAEHELLWVTPHGAVYGGSQAVAKILLASRGAWRAAGALLLLPPGRRLAPPLYRLVARNRHRMPGGTPACAAPAGHRRDGRTD